MRARSALANALWTLGREEEAVEHRRALIALNPQDNQGVRYELVHNLLQLQRTDEAEKVLARFEGDDSAMWAYAAALARFQAEGATSQANEFLREAVGRNPYVLEAIFRGILNYGKYAPHRQRTHPGAPKRQRVPR